MPNKKRKIIAIVGPTASGKTAVAVKLAKKFDGEIVSADSRQVFCGMDLGTGKDLSEYGDIKYHLIDIKNPGEKFTLFDYLPLARAAIEDIFSRGKLPIIVGGTGLYVQGLIEGFNLSEMDHEQNEPRKVCAREQLNKKTVEELQEILKDLDTEAFEKVDKQNPHRLIRAIEKAQAGEAVTKIKPDFEVLQMGLDLPREELYSRIDRRVDERFETGMLNEVAELLKSGVDAEWLMKLGLEYRIITQFLISVIPDLIRNPGNTDARQLTGSQISRSTSSEPEWKSKASLQSGMTTQVTVEFEEMKNLLKLRSHQYAKRQLTWFRRFPEIVWENNYKKISRLVENYLK